MSLRIGKEHTAVILAWWEGLDQDSGARARLRRCNSPSDVLLEPAFHRLLNRLQPLLEQNGLESREAAYTRLAAVAGLLAHVKIADDKKLAERLADPHGGGPRLSTLRFRRLIKEPFGDLYPAMIRVIRLLKYKAHVSDLVNSVYYWGDHVRRRWALAYFPKVSD